MPDKKPDRRVQRSLDLLLDALPALMIERGYERLTIQNLLDRAGVGRATFYAHFASKDELLAASVARLKGWLLDAWKAQPQHRLGFTLPFFQHLASHRRIYEMTVVRESENSVERHIRRMLRELVQQELAGRRPTPSADLATEYIVGALWSTATWWMESASAMSPEAVNGLFQRMSFPGLEVTLAEQGVAS